MIETLIQSGVVPVIRTPSAKLALRAAEWLHEAGFRTFEITMTIPGAIGVIDELSGDAEITVGAGTVLDAATASACIDAGAEFIVSPGLVESIVEPCRKAEVPCLLGAATPTEVLRGVELGADAIKIFPASSLGGVGHIKALKAVFPEVALVPTGGIAIEEIGAYLKAGAAFVGVGGQLVSVAALCKGDSDAIVDAAANAIEQVEAVRG